MLRPLIHALFTLITYSPRPPLQTAKLGRESVLPFLLSLSLAFWSQTAHTAGIKVHPNGEIFIQGELTAADGDAFRRKTHTISNIAPRGQTLRPSPREWWVTLQSVGGDLYAGLAIGEAIRAKGFKT